MGGVYLDGVRQLEQLPVNRLIKPTGQVGSNPATQQVNPRGSTQHQGSPGEYRSGFPLLLHHEGDVLWSVTGGVKDA